MAMSTIVSMNTSRRKILVYFDAGRYYQCKPDPSEVDNLVGSVTLPKIGRVLVLTFSHLPLLCLALDSFLSNTLLCVPFELNPDPEPIPGLEPEPVVVVPLLDIPDPNPDPKLPPISCSNSSV
jgi:hypothetical protein